MLLKLISNTSYLNFFLLAPVLSKHTLIMCASVQSPPVLSSSIYRPAFVFVLLLLLYAFKGGTYYYYTVVAVTRRRACLFLIDRWCMLALVWGIIPTVQYYIYIYIYIYISHRDSSWYVNKYPRTTYEYGNHMYICV